MLSWLLEAWWGKNTSWPQSDLSAATDTRIYSKKNHLELREQEDKEDGESLDVWGFRDTRFRADDDGLVEVTGERYPLSGKKLPYLLPWISKLMEVEVPLKPNLPSRYPPPIAESITNEPFITELSLTIKGIQITFDPEYRLRHGHGHSQGEMYAIKYANLPRIPDAIFYPTTLEDVSLVVQAALKHNISLIPYGGGTNVSEALACPPLEKRMIISVDMKFMNRISWIDPVNHMACIEAGAVGRNIMAELAKEGFTMGHEPDSIEFSTLGGWIATNASGMKKNKYGNIEDLVLDMTIVSTKGTLKRSEALPRESIGVDVRKLAFGSEGSLGIITSAVVKIFPLPQVQRYGSVLFPTFEDGVAFMYALTRIRGQPASIRLVDNLQFQLGQALKPVPTTFSSIISHVQKFYILNIKGFEPDKMVACTLVFEGTTTEVTLQENTLFTLAAKYKGLNAGAENGERGYLLTYNIAYIRDFGLSHSIIAESFETSVSWSNILSLCHAVRTRINLEHENRKLPGKPFVTCRVTQVYDTGVAVYFYFAYFCARVENPSGVYREIEGAAREEILRCGGALSHHHGVGELRKEFLGGVLGSEGEAWRAAIKRGLDPNNVFGV